MSAFRGRYQCKIDGKGRLSLPSAWRDLLQVNSLVITNNLTQNKPYLDLYTLEQWEVLEKKIAKMPSLKAEVQAYKRFYLSGGQVIQPDSQSRLLIPASLRDFAHISSDVQLVAMGNKIEVWSDEHWQQLQDKMTSGFEDTLALVAQLEEAM